MAINFQKQTAPGGSYTTVNLTTARVSALRIRFSYESPATATWTMGAPHHTRPLSEGDFVRIWDDAGTTPDGAAQSASNPLFEGYVKSAQPGAEANEVHYEASDPTVKCAAEFPIMSESWTASSGGLRPEPGATAFPRLIYNSKIDSDDDYAFERAHDYTLGQILKDIFDDQYNPLLYWNAANSSTSKAYVQAELDLFTFKPQEKFVFESESVRGAVERVLSQYEPAYRLFWTPGSREWRFHSLPTATEVTLTLNDWDATHTVLSLELHRSIEGRWAAVKIYGPQTLVQIEIENSDGDLDVIDSGVLLQNNIATCCNVTGVRQWQIVDADKRRMSGRLATPVDVQIGPFNWIKTKQPALLGYWNASGAVLFAGWYVINGWTYDPHTGILSMPDGVYAYVYNDAPAGGSPNYENATDYRLIYAYPDALIYVRYPETGHAGTAYSETGLANTLHMYDEMLAVGYEYGQPVTTAARLAQFQILTQRLHAERSRTIYAGGCTLEGIQYAFCRLGRRINIAGQDADGNAKITGWESIGAILTDVEYDFDNRLTTLSFSSDLAELLGLDVDQMHARLNIRALTLNQWSRATVNTVIRNKRFGDGNAFSFIGDTLQTTFGIETFREWVDQYGQGESFNASGLGPGAS